MPTYEFECEECGYITEVLLNYNEDAKAKCDSCGSEKTHKIISSCGFIITSSNSKNVEAFKRKQDMNNDLSENYGITQLHPIAPPELKGRPNTIDQVYKEIKEKGSYAKEVMQARMEKTKKEQAEKGKAWRKNSLAKSKENVELIKKKKGKI